MTSADFRAGMRRASRGITRVGAALAAIVRRARFVWPPVGMVRFGSLRRLTPISRDYGLDRGQPVDRYYIEDFLARHSGFQDYVRGDIHGHVLEIGGDYYARKFGGWGESTGAVTRLDVLHADGSNPNATIIADLANTGMIAPNSFDCVICTQTLLLIFDVHAAVRELHRILKPDGVVLATVPGISRICRPDVDAWGDYWRFTSRSARMLFEQCFPPESIVVEAYGNVLSAIAMLEGIATEELRRHELDVRDPDYEVLITVRARKRSVADGIEGG